MFGRIQGEWKEFIIWPEREIVSVVDVMHAEVFKTTVPMSMIYFETHFLKMDG